MGSPLFSRAIAKGQPQSAGIDSGGQPDFRTTQDSDHQDDGQGGSEAPFHAMLGSDDCQWSRGSNHGNENKERKYKFKQHQNGST